jgi:phosphate-selective porin OprO and OprP
VIRYTRHTVFLVALGLSAAARAQSSPGGEQAASGKAEAEAAVSAVAPPPTGTVVAQAAGTPPPVPPAEAPAPGAPPAAAPAIPSAEEAARLEEVEQLARIAARKHEILEEQADKRAKEAPKVTADDKGFSLALPDKSYVLKIRGLMQADGRFFFENDTLQANDTFLIRRFRPAIEGTLFSIVDYRLLPEFAGTVQILDAYADLHPRDWLRLRVGKMKAPIGLERLQSDADLPLLERGLDQNLSSSRDIGIQLWGDVAGGIVYYAIGVFNGSPDTNSTDNNDIDHAKDFMGRLFFQPFKTEALSDFGSLGVGISAGTGNRKGRLPTAVAGLPVPSVAAQTGLSPFRTAGQNTFFQYLAPPTDTTGALTTFTHERSTRINPQLYYYYRSFGLLAEYLWLKQGVQRGNSTTELTQQAAHATVSYTIGGTEGYDGATPEYVFDPGQGRWGALQLAVRYGWLGIDDATFPTYANEAVSARSAQAITGGAAWVLRRSFRLAVNFEQTRFKGGNQRAAMGMNPAVITDRLTEYVLIGRAQVNF